MQVILLANWHAAPGYKKGDVVDLSVERVSYGLKAGLCALPSKKKQSSSKKKAHK